MLFTREFQYLGKNDAATAGGKGASLGEMTQAGIPVPPGFVILADAFEQFLKETDLNVEIDSILHSVNHQEMHTVEHASERIQKLILEAKMPEDIAGEITQEFHKLGAEFVAVRSSATAEDSSSAAWAGQLDSFLNTTEETLLQNVQKCWASIFTPRAIFYRFEKGLHDQKISVSVVIQKMVASEKSGIAFSVHPVTEDRNQLIIEAGFGLGEAIVSGQITPDSYVVEKEKETIQARQRDIIIGEGNLAGKGIYAARDFKKGEIIISYNLIPLTQQEFDNLSQGEKEFTHKHYGVIHLYSEPERYVNHSSQPNTYQDLTHWRDIALRDIRRGEMITTDATKDDV
jgi:pyruvate,water dikinase